MHTIKVIFAPSFCPLLLRCIKENLPNTSFKDCAKMSFPVFLKVSTEWVNTLKNAGNIKFEVDGVVIE